MAAVRAPSDAYLPHGPVTQLLRAALLDGEPAARAWRDGRVALYSRTGKDWTASFPSIVEAARALTVRDALIDGEIAVVLPDGRTSFQSLQNRLGDGYEGYCAMTDGGWPVLFRPVLRKLVADGPQYFGAGAIVVEPIRQLNRPFSTLLQVRVANASGSAASSTRMRQP